MKHAHGLVLALLTGSVVLANAAHASPDCYDAIVSARIISQKASAMPECDDCIIMQWPWFLELDVENVDVGDVAKGRHVMQAMLHTRFRNDLGVMQWLLRRNALGGFNVLRGTTTDATLCPPEIGPAQPYLRPGGGETLLDVQKEPEAQ